MEKYITELAMAHLSNVMETIKNHSSMKKIEQVQNFKRNAGDLKNSKNNLKFI